MRRGSGDPGRRLPNFMYIGPDKAGSSWLHEVLIRHPQVFLTPAKDLYFFDRYFDRGLDWYAAFFAKAGDEPIVGEVCQEYLFEPAAPGRIRSTLGRPRFMVTLRDPVERAFSSYLYMHRIGERPGAFGEALRTRPILLDHGRYATGLGRFADEFGEDAIHVAVFDDLVADPSSFVQALLRWLGIEPFDIPDDLLAARLPAAEARSRLVARGVRDLAAWARDHNGAELVGRIKRAPLVQRALYVPMQEKPQVDPRDAAFIRAELDAELRLVEARFDVVLRDRWGWAGA
jgi:hypothetical protein